MGRQKKKVLYLCGNLKTYNHGIFLSVDWHTMMSGVPGKSPFQQPISINIDANENEC
jgi:hypothetical protein